MTSLAQRVAAEGLTRNDLRRLRRGESLEAATPADVIEVEEAPEPETEPDAATATRSAPVPPRRVTYRSKAGITVTVYLNAEEISLADIERSLLEAIRELRSKGLPELG
jgi:hypothetical protein